MNATPSRLHTPANMAVHRRQQAFTLVEIMIAIGIFSMVMVAIYGSWSSILRSTRIGQDAAAEAQHIRMAVRCLEDALLSVQAYTENAQHYAFYADTGGDYGYLSLAAHLPKSFPGGGIYGDQSVRRVSFSVDPGPERQNQLVMRQIPLLSPTNAASDLSYSVVLAEDVSAFLLEFWDSNRGEWMRDWVLTNQLPKMVRFTLGIGRQRAFQGRPREIITRDVALNATAIPVEFQMGTATANNATRGTLPINGANPLPSAGRRK